MSALIDNSACFKAKSHRELLLGCGNRLEKRIWLNGEDQGWSNLTTLDIDPAVKPDVVFDLDKLGAEPLPFEDNTFNEIHAYEVLEHFGRQGDWKGFLAQFAEFWRILVPDGLFFATVPHWESSWAWADPGHTRVIPKDALVFLSQEQYAGQVGGTPMTDYRPWYKANFETVAVNEQHPDVLKFVLLARK